MCLIVCETKDKGSLTYWLIYILVAQQAEALDLKSIQYEFESHRGYSLRSKKTTLKKLKNILQSVWQIKSDYISL